MKQAKILMLYFVILLLFNIFAVAQQTKTSSDLQAVRKWFSAWELVSKEIYNINTLQPVEFVFFDETDVYSTSKTSVPDGEPVSGPNLLNQKLTWKKAIHNGKLTLPDKQVVPVGLMSFASPLAGENSFFVMPLPEFWKNAGVESKELGFENLVTGVFLHEFSHSQQMRNFGKKLSEYEQKHTFSVEFSDDIVQDYFKNDAIYTQHFLEEVKLFYESVTDKSNIKLTQAIGLLKKRQQTYFTGEKNIFSELDDFFLTMEGLGQFTMYVWMIHAKGGNVSKENALTGVRRGKKWWSQEQGLALFLVLNNLSKPKQWAKLMFAKEPVSVVELIEKKLKRF